jgi:Mn2+/Fe2+ NRAMP family transporter
MIIHILVAHPTTVAQREGASKREIRRSRKDVLTGMSFSNLVMYFIILTSASTLHAHGKTTISTARDAAEALRPLAGDGAYWLLSLGLIGAGMLGVPVLAGSCAYAIAEAANWVARWRYTLPWLMAFMRSSASQWHSA